MEHWLPLFGAPLVGTRRYLPQAVITLDHQADEANVRAFDTITDFYSARKDLQRAERESGAGVYKPLPPNQSLPDRCRLEEPRPRPHGL